MTHRATDAPRGQSAPARGRLPLAALALVLLAAPVVAQDAPAPPPPAGAPPPEAVEESLADEFPFEFSPEAADDDLASIPRADSMQAREAPQSTLERYRADPEFQYEGPEAERPSLWDRLWSWFVREFLTPVGQGMTSEGGRYMLIVLAFLAIAWVITRLLRAEGGSIFGKKDLDASGATYGPLLDVDDIREVDVTTLLADALRDGRLRDAVRFRYVLALQRLAQADVIVWRRDTTNREYVAQARASGGASLANPLADVTRAFDYVWYGERPVDRARYARLEPLFTRLDDALAAPRQRPLAT